MSEEERVRVAIRLRPLLPREHVKNVRSCIRVVPENSQLILGQDRAFTFDQILGPEANQETVFNTCIVPLIDGWFQGYNVTAFAYGQTGSGKTYTIEGPPGLSSFESDERGLLPRALQKIFTQITSREEDVEVNLGVTYVEIYQEELCDLLHVSASSHDLHIREDNKGNTVLVGVREVKIRSLQDALSLLEEGSSARRSGMTRMNVHSSRSHSIFTLRLEEKKGEQYVTAKFRFVDLAGSERAHKTENKGGRFKESVFINSGLLALGNVISALGDPKRKATHIPYRNSKITRVLKDSLGGNGRTVMLTCLSPSENSFAESLNSLKYANRAKNIRNKPVVNKDPQLVRMEEMQSQIEALKEELIRTQTAGTVGIRSSQSEEMDEKSEEIEDELIRIRRLCSSYRSCVVQARHLLLSLKDAGTLSDNHLKEYSVWDLSVKQAESEEDGALVSNESVLAQLQSELARCKSELASDEEIFAEKVMEIQAMKDELREAKSTSDLASNQLLQIHEANAQLRDALEAREAELASLNEMINSQRTLLSEQEQALLLKDREMLEQREQLVPYASSARPLVKDVAVQAVLESRKQSGSGAGVSFVRPWTAPHEIKPPQEIVQEFRAQSRLLLARIDDEEKICFPDFSSDSEEEEMEGVLGKTRTLRPAGNPPDELIMDSLNISITTTTSKLKEAKTKYQESQQKLRDLQFGIRLKQELIRELVKSGEKAQTTNKQYAEKLKKMEKDVAKTKAELESMKKRVEEQNGEDTALTQQLKSEYKKKLLSMQQKLAELQKKQKTSGAVAGFQKDSEKRLKEVEASLSRKKDEQEILKRKLKQTADSKSKMEQELVTYQQQVKDLRTKTEQQKKLLRRKTEEVAVASRKLRQRKPAEETEEIQTLKSKLLVQQQWLDNEVERVLGERETVAAVERDLAERERIVKEREDVLAEMSALEMKKLRSSQILSKDLLRVSVQLGSVEEKMKKAEKDSGLSAETVGKALQGLKKQRDELVARQKLLEKESETAETDSVEEQRLMELEEAIETLDAAIEFKNQEISSGRKTVERVGNDQSIVKHLREIAPPDLRRLLGRYFEKVVSLREKQKEKEAECSELKLNIEELELRISEIEKSARLGAAEADVQLTELQKAHEKEVQALLSQLNEANAEINQSTTVDDASALQARIQELEKDLYYYKTTSRELKKKLREMSGSQESDKQPVAVKKSRKLLKELSATDLASRPGAKSSLNHDGK
ncbi:kinesin-like protein KIF27 [Oscarella lobularis]|uniref:kinesin-like protein KIF27 n=1 Tax=Oscarella lobularis TaxID=121494 RepID=UPI0033136004